MKAWLKWVGIILLIPVVLVLLVSVLLYVPPIQNFVLRKASQYASQATGLQIGFDRIRLSFPLDLSVSGIEVISPPADTLVMAKELKINVSPLPLIRKQVYVSWLELTNTRIQTGSYIEGVEVNGTVNRLAAHTAHIGLTEQTISLRTIGLSDGNISVLINDTTPKVDTVKTATQWVIDLNKIELDRLAFQLDMPADTLTINTYIEAADLYNGNVDLANSVYTASQFTLKAPELNYDKGVTRITGGFDPAHIAVRNASLTVDSIRNRGQEISLSIKDLALSERSGIVINSLQGQFRSDSLTIAIPQMMLKTPSSSLRLTATAPWTSFQTSPSGNMQARLAGSVGKRDLLLFAGTLPEEFQRAYPNVPLRISAGITGNLNNLIIQQFIGDLPQHLHLELSGKLRAVTDNERLSGQVKFNAVAQNIDFVKTLLPPDQRNQFRIPHGIRLNGEGSVSRQEYAVRAYMTESQARVNLAGRYNIRSEAYQANIRVSNLQPNHYIPNDSLLWLSATIQANGRGTDFYSASTRADVKGDVNLFRYGSLAISDVNFTGSLQNNNVLLDLVSNYPLADMDLTVDGILRREAVSGTVAADVRNLDLYNLHLVTDSVALAFQLFAQGESDLNQTHAVDLTAGNWDVVTPQAIYHPKLLTLHALTDPDTTRISLHTGDLGVVVSAEEYAEDLISQLTILADTVNYQLQNDTTLRIASLRPLLPEMELEAVAGTDNPLYNYMQQINISFDSIHVGATTSPEEGIMVDADIFKLQRDTTRLDTIRFELYQDMVGLTYYAEVVKNRYRRQEAFKAEVHGKIRDTFADAELLYLNAKKDTGIFMGVQVQWLTEGYRFSLFPEDPVIAFHSFTVNPDNYVIYRSTTDIEADLRLTGEDNASLWIHSSPASGTMEELYAELSQINLERVSEGFSNMPHIEGILNAEVQYMPVDSSFQLVANAFVDTLVYERDTVGELMLNATYLPLGNNQQQIDVHLLRDEREALTANGILQTGANRQIDGTALLTNFPLEIISPFIPDDQANLYGFLQGDIAFQGPAQSPLLNGYLQFDSASVFVTAVGYSYRMDDKQIPVSQGIVTFDQYRIFASENDPFVIDGTVDTRNFSNMIANLKLDANNIELLNAEKTDESIIYGRLLVDMHSTIKGPLNALAMRGDLNLQGGTNATFVLRESSLTVQDRLDGLVIFTSFTDTVMRNREPEPPRSLGGMDILLTIRIDQSVQLNADITPDGSNFVRLEGGGDLSFQYNPQGDMNLAGRYTLTGGTFRYTLPVVPLKDFNIHEGSYVQWVGDPVNPEVSLTATERVKTSVADASNTRLVNFDVGVNVTGDLENLALRFTLDAPEDMAVQTQIAAMGEEEETKQAVGMLVTGKYLLSSGDGGMNLDMGSALNSFLQNEITNIAGNALESVDITLGVNSYDENGSEGGGRVTDYSFQFSKRFYDDRIRVVVGGRVSTGGEVNSGEAQSYLDDVAVEYRLDQSGTRYVRVFHERNYESLLEGEVVETGAGLVLRKKMRYLRELFMFKKRKVQPVDEEEVTDEEQT